MTMQRTSKRIRKVTLPPMPEWDQGATGQANRVGLEVEPVMMLDEKTGKMVREPNGIKRARRVDMVEHWFRKGVLSTGAYNAAEALRNAFEATMRAPGMAQSERVDSSPKPDHAVAIQVDRISRFVAVMRHVNSGDRALIDVCVLSGGTPAKLAGYKGRNYQAGLTALNAALERVNRAMESK